MLKKMLSIASGLLLVLLSACSLPGSVRVLNTTPGSVTTLCPATGTARAAIVPALKQGKHANLIYYNSEYRKGDDGTLQLKRLDITSNTSISIARLSNGGIVDAQISTDGQWILFTLGIDQPHPHLELRLIRMDGQYQQTLFCWPALDSSSRWGNGRFVWSPDGTLVALNMVLVQENQLAIYLLDLAQGQAQLELTSATGPLRKLPSGETYAQWTEFYYPMKWLDTTHLSIEGVKQVRSLGGPERQTIYQLDTGKGAGQHTADLQPIFSSASQISGLKMCDFDSNPGTAQVFIASCTSQAQGGWYQGPSTITAQPATGGQASTIYRTPDFSIDKIEAVNSQTLLFLSQTPAGNGLTGDSLWKINTDGSGLKRLLSDGNFTWCGLEVFQPSCANVSRDGNWYALFSYNRDNTTTLVYGSLNGGPLKTATDLNPLASAFVGWTEM